MKKITLLSGTLLVALCLSPSAHGQVVSVQLNGNSLGGGTLTAGAPGFVESAWNTDTTGYNNFVGPNTSGPVGSLKDSSGTITMVSESTTNDGYYQPTGNAGFSGAGDVDLYSTGFLTSYSGGPGFVLNLTGLSSSSTYDLVFYTTSTFDFGSPAEITATAGGQNYYYDATLSSQSVYTQGISINSSAPTANANYVVFSGLTATGGDLSASLSGTNVFNVDGFQLEAFAAAPEPSTWAMMLAGLAVLGFCVRRKGILVK